MEIGLPSHIRQSSNLNWRTGNLVKLLSQHQMNIGSWCHLTWRMRHQLFSELWTMYWENTPGNWDRYVLMTLAPQSVNQIAWWRIGRWDCEYIVLHLLMLGSIFNHNSTKIRDSLVARITACRVVDRGSIPRRGVYFFSKKRYESRG